MLRSRKVCVLKPPISAARVMDATAWSAGRAARDDRALAMPWWWRHKGGSKAGVSNSSRSYVMLSVLA